MTDLPITIGVGGPTAEYWVYEFNAARNDIDSWIREWFAGTVMPVPPGPFLTKAHICDRHSECIRFEYFPNTLIDAEGPAHRHVREMRAPYEAFVELVGNIAKDDGDKEIVEELRMHFWRKRLEDNRNLEQ